MYRSLLAQPPTMSKIGQTLLSKSGLAIDLKSWKNSEFKSHFRRIRGIPVYHSSVSSSSKKCGFLYIGMHIFMYKKSKSNWMGIQSFYSSIGLFIFIMLDISKITIFFCCSKEGDCCDQLICVYASSFSATTEENGNFRNI